MGSVSVSPFSLSLFVLLSFSCGRGVGPPALFSRTRALSAAELSIVVQVQTRGRGSLCGEEGEGKKSERGPCTAMRAPRKEDLKANTGKARGVHTHYKRDVSLVEEEMVHASFSNSQISE